MITIYLSYFQVQAIEKAAKELEELFPDIMQTLTIFNNGINRGSWIVLDMPTEAFIFWLGFYAGRVIGENAIIEQK